MTQEAFKEICDKAVGRKNGVVVYVEERNIEGHFEMVIPCNNIYHYFRKFPKRYFEDDEEESLYKIIHAREDR